MCCITVEGDWCVERDDGHVTSQSVGVPVGVDGEAGGRDGDLAGLVLVAELRAESQREESDTISAVSIGLLGGYSYTLEGGYSRGVPGG